MREQPLPKKELRHTYWFHAASGEIEYCKSVIRLLKQKKPRAQVVVTYTSPSAEKLFDNIITFVDYIFPLPWDTQSATVKCLNHFSPKALIFSRTDFWPELILKANKFKVPLFAISIYPRFNIFSPFLYKIIFKKFRLITTVNPETSQRLEQLGITNVMQHSDTRFDQVFARLSQPSKLHFNSKKLSIVFASTWPEDEKIIFPVIESIISQKNRFQAQIIICPHEPARNLQIKNHFARYNCKLLSECNDFLHIDSDFELLIIDIHVRKLQVPRARRCGDIPCYLRTD